MLNMAKMLINFHFERISDFPMGELVHNFIVPFYNAKMHRDWVNCIISVVTFISIMLNFVLSEGDMVLLII